MCLGQHWVKRVPRYGNLDILVRNIRTAFESGEETKQTYGNLVVLPTAMMLPTAVVPTKPLLPTWRHVGSSTAAHVYIIAARLAICNKWERKTRGTWASGESLPPLTSSLGRGLLVRLPRVAPKKTNSPLRLLLQSVIIIEEHEAVFHTVFAYITEYWPLLGLLKVPSAIMTDDKMFFALFCTVAIFFGSSRPGVRARQRAVLFFAYYSLE